MLVKDVIKESKLIQKLMAVGLLTYEESGLRGNVIYAQDVRNYWVVRDNKLWYKNGVVIPESVEMIEAAIKDYFQEGSK